MTLPQLYFVLLVGGTVLLASIAAARMASRIGLPSLLLFLAVGVVVGEDVLGVDFDDAQLAQALGTAALAVILVDGGLTSQWTNLRRLMLPAGVLATAGVAISVVLTAAGAHWLLGMEWQLALLLAAIVSSTDAAAVFAVLRALPLPQKVTALVEAESGLNDAPTVILVLVFSTAAADLPSPAYVVGNMVFQLALGTTIGLGIGWLGVVALRHIALPATGLYPLATVGFGVTAFAAAGAANASGIIAAYLAGLVLGNSSLPHRAATRSFAEGAGWLAQIGLFVMLGLLVTPSELPSAVLPALVVGLVLLLVARPASVLACLLPFRTPWREQAFISWAGLRGAVPIVLTTFPIVAGVPGSREVLKHRLRPRRHLHPRPGPQPACRSAAVAGGPTRRSARGADRSRPTGHPRRRTAHRRHTAEVQAARRCHLRTTAASAHRHHLHRSQRRQPRARPRHRAALGRRAAADHHAQYS
jgi:cell volume regulation protein A